MFTSSLKRSFATAASFACAAVLLAACGGGGDADSTDASTALQGSAAFSTTDAMLAGASGAPSVVAGVAVTNWTQCANENSTCSFSGTREVRYGSGNTWVTRTATSSIACNNAVFGDPLPGANKVCQYSPVIATAPTWTQCATENNTCSFSGTREVRYGSGSTWTTRIATGSVACSNAVFGDPLPTVNKTCQYSSVSATVPAPAPAVSWSQCATENGSCSFSGTREVRYGSGNTWVTRVATGSVACNNAIFGDPLPTVNKVCQVASTTTSSPSPTPAPAPAPAPAPTPTPAPSWTQCATENGNCSFSGTREVRYGSGSTWATRVATGSIACNNAVFGDPLPTVNKVCQYSGTTTTSPTPAPSPTPSPSPTPAPSPSASGPYGQDASQYTLTFADEFDNGFNTSRWNDKIWYESSNPTKNYAVEDGKLKIWPQRDASGNFFNRTIDTDGKFYQTYGFFEIEAKLPYGRGPWPAFWLLNHDRNHPDRPEIDILEAYPGGGAGSGWSDSSLRPTTYAATVWPKGIEGGSAAGSLKIPNTGDLSGGFHKYAVKWEPSKITFYFDGKAVYSVNASMNDRMYILLDLWFGSASGNPDNSTPTGKGNSFEVNYVRVWQFK